MLSNTIVNPDSTATPAPAAAFQASPLLLIADDEPTTRLLLRKAMQKENFRVIEARNGKECLEMCQQQHPDIVLMDAVMPEMDGFDCCSALKALPENDAPPVLMITGLDDPASDDRIFEVGAADYISKPIHWALLRQRVYRLQDILKRRQAEARIKASLQEKEALLKEVHHRVKNNLQIISSLINLQSDTIKDPKVLEIFKESQNRVRLMALIHEQLYQSKNLGKIALKDYIQSLSDNLLRSYGVNQGEITLNLEIDDINLETDAAVSCGLMINELISNTLKYAFPPTSGNANTKENLISIQAKRTHSNLFSIHYKDNGIGIPKSLDIQTLSTLGLQLVSSLTEQLGGTLHIISNEFTLFELIDLQAS